MAGGRAVGRSPLAVGSYQSGSVESEACEASPRYLNWLASDGARPARRAASAFVTNSTKTRVRYSSERKQKSVGWDAFASTELPTGEQE
jgi:hypothetical protein